MGIYKRGKHGFYWYRFEFNGVEIRESTKQTNDKIARQMESAHRVSLAKGEVGIREKKTAPSLKTFCKDRIEPYAKPLPSWTWYRSGIRALLKYDQLAKMPLDEIRGEHAAGFAAWRLADKLAPGSINSSLRVLRRILKLAEEWGVISATPKITLLSGEARRERVVTPDEEAKYLDAASPFLREVATVLFDTGLRPDELHRMAWPEVAWDNARHGTILVTTGKTAAARRQIPMTPRVRGVLEARWCAQDKPATGWVWPSDTKTGHIDHSTTKKQHRRALNDSKVPPFVLYSLRHTFLTRLGASGCDVWTLMRVAGHSSIAISSRYVHPHQDTVLNALESMTNRKQLKKGSRSRGRHKTTA